MEIEFLENFVDFLIETLYILIKEHIKNNSLIKKEATE
ncbi:hypothetical protein SD78_3080 [Bacillus badius]|nr:hypothetical protein SD78_3080 [Bacillus badius]